MKKIKLLLFCTYLLSAYAFYYEDGSNNPSTEGCIETCRPSKLVDDHHTSYSHIADRSLCDPLPLFYSALDRHFPAKMSIRIRSHSVSKDAAARRDFGNIDAKPQIPQKQTPLYGRDQAVCNSNNVPVANFFACAVSLSTPTTTLCSGSNSNNYALSGQVALTDPPASGTLTISVTGGQSQVFNAPFSSTIDYTINKLIADGQTRTVTASLSANAGCVATVNYNAPSSVGTGFSSFPIGTTVSDFLWGTSPYPQQSWDNGYVPGYGGPFDFGGGVMDIDLVPPGVTNLAALCAEMAEGVAGGSGSNYTNKYKYVPLEFISRGHAGEADESQNIPVGGIGKVRAGMLRFLFDSYYTSTSAAAWSNEDGAAFQLAVWEIIHEVYTSNSSFSVKNASLNGFYFLATYNLAAVDKAETYVTAVNNKNWTNEQWASYEPTSWHVIGVENNINFGGNGAQDMIFAQPIVCTPSVCSSTVTASAGACNPATNQYTASGQITLTNPPSTGTVTVQIVGGGNQTFTLPQSSPISYSIAGQTADGANHTINVSISGVSCGSSTTYNAPSNCTPLVCSSTVTATAGACNPATNQYTASGQIALTNPPSTGTVTVQIVGGGNQTFTLPQSSPISYSIAGQTADGASHTINVSISGVSCASSTTYNAPSNCTPLVCSSTVTASTGACNPATNQYTVSGQIALTNPPSTGTVTVQIVGGGNQTFTLPQSSPISYSIAGQTADGASHTVNVTISGVSCATSTTYTAPSNCTPSVCSSTVTATAGACNPATNQFTVSGQIALTNPPSTGTVTVQIVGGGNQTFTLPQSSPISYSIAGQTADGASHTVNVTISGVSCASSTTYNAPSNCTPSVCSSTVTATAGACNPATNHYTVSGQIALTNPPSTGTVTVQIVGGGNQTFTLPQSSPISYSIAGQTADGASHTINVSISGVSCASSTAYNAPVSCSTVPCPNPNCVTLKSKKAI